MATAITTPDAPAYKLPGVNLFATGEYRGKQWTTSHLDAMAANARRLGPRGLKLLVPPSVLGHEEEQEWLDRTDLPAAGWVDPNSVHVVPDPRHPGHAILKGDVVNVPPEVAAMIAAGEFRHGSVEIYDDFKDDFGRSYGKTIRRFAFLGGEVPQVKRLGPLPKPVPMAEPLQFAERPVVIRERTVRDGPHVLTFAETTPMDRASMTAAIQAAMPGISQAFLDALSDDQLAELVKNAPAGAPAAAAAPAPPGGLMAEGDPPAEDADMTREELIAALTDAGEDPASLEGMTDEELMALLEDIEAEGAEGPPDAAMAEGDPVAADPAAMTREDLIAQLTALGQDAAALQGMTDDDLRALFTQLSAAPAPAAAAPPAVAPMSDYQRGLAAAAKKRWFGGQGKIARALGFSEPRPRAAQREAKKMLTSAARLERFAEVTLRKLQRREAESKRADAVAFCDRLVRDGRATPAQVKVLHLPLLLQLDDTSPVHAFTESGKTRRETAYERKKRELAALAPVIRFGERLPGGKVENSTEAEAEKVRRFAETLTETAVKAAGYRTREQFVERFCEARKKSPTLTAAEYLGPGAVA